ncbi:MAG: GGDEF domain-containing protein [Solirubrobacteraceae bacterium]
MPEPGSGPRPVPIIPRLAVIAATAAATALAHGQDAFWICIPSALLLSAWSRTIKGVAIGSAAAVTAAAVPILVSKTAQGPSIALAVLIPAASVAILLVVRERVERERNALRTTALTDPLTGLANRRSLLSRVDYEIARHTRSRGTFAVIMLDLDGFKLLNDRFGHPTGDDLLRDVAVALKRAVRDQDTVARIGGDEFCVLAPETDEPGTDRLISRITTAVARVTTGVDSLAASAGAAAFPDDGTTRQAIFAAADDRLLAAKRSLPRQRRRAA